MKNGPSAKSSLPSRNKIYYYSLAYLFRIFWAYTALMCNKYTIYMQHVTTQINIFMPHK